MIHSYRWLGALLRLRIIPVCIVFLATAGMAQEEQILSVNSESSAQDKTAYHEQGRAIYNFRCYFCHGYSGDARTLTTTFINPPPRDFTRTQAGVLSRQQMLGAVTHGKSDTAMTAFSRVLSPQQISAVVDFIRLEFMQNGLPNTRYHTVQNGWPDHQRYADAFPFATVKSRWIHPGRR